MPLISESWENFDNTIKGWYKYSEVQDAFEEFVETEAKWNSFLSSLDRRLKRGGPTTSLTLGQSLNFDLDLVNVR